MKKNGKRKEYHDNGELKFEGEYLNGKRNRKGKKYYDIGILKFEDEYLNGERNGKWQKYHQNSELRFEGEYLKGNRWNGKGYTKDGNIANKLNHEKGYIKEYYYYKNRLEFEGQ